MNAETDEKSEVEGEFDVKKRGHHGQKDKDE